MLLISWARYIGPPCSVLPRSKVVHEKQKSYTAPLNNSRLFFRAVGARRLQALIPKPRQALVRGGRWIAKTSLLCSGRISLSHDWTKNSIGWCSFDAHHYGRHRANRDAAPNSHTSRGRAAREGLIVQSPSRRAAPGIPMARSEDPGRRGVQITAWRKFLCAALPGLVWFLQDSRTLRLIGARGTDVFKPRGIPAARAGIAHGSCRAAARRVSGNHSGFAVHFPYG
jgi:hypothetical protein